MSSRLAPQDVPLSGVRSTLVSEAYQGLRHFVSETPFVEPKNDLPDHTPISSPTFDGNAFANLSRGVQNTNIQTVIQQTTSAVGSGQSFERLYHQELAKNAQMTSEYEALRKHELSLAGEKERMKYGYEEFIARMNAEMEQLKRTQVRLDEANSLKGRLEAELEIVSRQLQSLKGASDDSVTSELRRVINQLVEEKKQLRAAIAAHQIEINKLTVDITTLREVQGSDSGEAKSKLISLQAEYDKLLSNYNQMKTQPVLAPPNVELETLLRERVKQIHFLEGQVNDLQTRLREREKSREVIYCKVCDQKQAHINHLNSQFRTVEVKPIIIEQSATIPTLEPITTYHRAPVVKTETVLPVKIVRVQAPPVYSEMKTYTSAPHHSSVHTSHLPVQKEYYTQEHCCCCCDACNCAENAYCNKGLGYSFTQHESSLEKKKHGHHSRKHHKKGEHVTQHHVLPATTTIKTTAPFHSTASNLHLPAPAIVKVSEAKVSDSNLIPSGRLEFVRHGHHNGTEVVKNYRIAELNPADHHHRKKEDTVVVDNIEIVKKMHHGVPSEVHIQEKKTVTEHLGNRSVTTITEDHFDTKELSNRERKHVMHQMHLPQGALGAHPHHLNKFDYVSREERIVDLEPKQVTYEDQRQSLNDGRKLDTVVVTKASGFIQ